MGVQKRRLPSQERPGPDLDEKEPLAWLADSAQPQEPLEPVQKVSVKELLAKRGRSCREPHARACSHRSSDEAHEEAFDEALPAPIGRMASPDVDVFSVGDATPRKGGVEPPSVESIVVSNAEVVSQGWGQGHFFESSDESEDDADDFKAPQKKRQKTEQALEILTCGFCSVNSKVHEGNEGFATPWYETRKGKLVGPACLKCGTTTEAWLSENLTLKDCLEKWEAGDKAFKKESRVAQRVQQGQIPLPWNKQHCHIADRVCMKLYDTAIFVYRDWLITSTRQSRLKAFALQSALCHPRVARRKATRSVCFTINRKLPTCQKP